MGDHMTVFRSLCELFPQVDPRMLKAVAIEHSKDPDSAVVAILDEIMPSMVGSVGAPSAGHEAEAAVSEDDFARNLLSSNQKSVRETGSSSSAGSTGISSIHHEPEVFVGDLVRNVSANHAVRETGSSSSAGYNVRDEANGSFDSARCTSSTEVITDTQENVVGELDQVMMRKLLDVPFYPAPERSFDRTLENHLRSCYTRNLDHSDNPVGNGGSLSNEYIVQSPTGKNWNGSIDLNVAPVQEQDFGDSSSKFPCNYLDICYKTSAPVPNSEVSPKFVSIEKDDFASMLDLPIPDTREPFVGSAGVLVRKDTNIVETDSNAQQSGHRIDAFLFSGSDLLPDLLNSNNFVSMASTQSSHSVSIESLEDSIADAKNKKNDLLPSLELVTKMIEDVELLEEKAKVAKRESSIAGTSILTKVEELKEMLNHAKEANDMHAGEVFGERSILTTEARELQSRLQRLSEERNSYLVVIEEIQQTLEERLAAAQQEYEDAEKEKVEKEASAQALLSKQEKEMNYIVEESRKLQKEAEENLKLKDFLVERGRIVDTLQGEMSVICEDVSQLKRIVDGRLSWSKLQRSTISSLSSSLHSSLHKSGSSSERTVEAVESTDKHTVAEGTGPAVEDLDVNERMAEMIDGCDSEGAGWVVEDNGKQGGSSEDGWEILNDDA